MARFTFIFSLLASLAGKAQNDKEILQLMNTAKAENKNFYYEIPFEYRNGWIVIQVKIGGELYDYIFDTGGYNDVTAEIADRNKFPVIATQTVGSANRIKSEFDIVKVDSLQIGGLVFRDIAALKFNALPPTMKCTVNGALIGASIIKNYVWQIDYPNKKLIVTDQLNKISGLDRAVKIPVTFNKRLMPYIKVKFNGHMENIMFDLGSSFSFTMTEKGAQKYSEGKKVVEITGSGSEGGNGILKESVKLMNIDLVEINAVKLQNQLAAFTHSVTEMLIGSPVIKQCIVTLDFSNSEMYFLPVKDSNANSFETFGMTIKYEQGKFKIEKLYKGLAADQAGIMLNDEVTGIQGEVLQCNDTCECMDFITALMQRKKELTLTIIRNGKERIVSVKKEKAF